jgi:hypothetical protein
MNAEIYYSTYKNNSNLNSVKLSKQSMANSLLCHFYMIAWLIFLPSCRGVVLWWVVVVCRGVCVVDLLSTREKDTRIYKYIYRKTENIFHRSISRGYCTRIR